MPNDIQEEIEKLKVCVKSIEGLLNGNSGDFRLELISLRKTLSAQMSSVQALLEEDGTSLDRSVASKLRSEFSSARTRLAMHQASWPAVKIDEDIEGYRSSGQAAINELLSFVRTAEQNIPR